ncbi:PREDICTED: uncharacterized protein LOC105854395 [Condylura cristata]|uniref:uncharacterized protein LOC105854395 n=1 Tax=Condylura cristata TaxID=143302 RepID=UPI000642C956|nr:PREDICTED: uncharacterized protein LOC105854395 [Condylura cristata]
MNDHRVTYAEVKLAKGSKRPPVKPQDRKSCTTGIEQGITYAELNLHKSRGPQENGKSLQCKEYSCGPCPQGWLTYSNSCYYFSPEPKTWNESVSDCQRNNSQLLLIDNDEEMRFFTSIKRLSWVGVYRNGPGQPWTLENGAVSQLHYYKVGAEIFVNIKNDQRGVSSWDISPEPHSQPRSMTKAGTVHSLRHRKMVFPQGAFRLDIELTFVLHLDIAKTAPPDTSTVPTVNEGIKVPEIVERAEVWGVSVIFSEMSFLVHNFQSKVHLVVPCPPSSQALCLSVVGVNRVPTADCHCPESPPLLAALLLLDMTFPGGDGCQLPLVVYGADQTQAERFFTSIKRLSWVGVYRNGPGQPWTLENGAVSQLHMRLSLSRLCPYDSSRAVAILWAVSKDSRAAVRAPSLRRLSCKSELTHGELPGTESGPKGAANEGAVLEITDIVFDHRSETTSAGEDVEKGDPPTLWLGSSGGPVLKKTSVVVFSQSRMPAPSSRRAAEMNDHRVTYAEVKLAKGSKRPQVKPKERKSCTTVTEQGITYAELNLHKSRGPQENGKSRQCKGTTFIYTSVFSGVQRGRGEEEWG